MKFVVALLIIAASGYCYPSDDVAPLNPKLVEKFANATIAIKECKEKHTLSVENLANLFKTGHLLDEEDKAGQCYVNCVLEKGKFVVDGTFNADEAKSLISEKFAALFGHDHIAIEKAEEAVKSCTDGHDDHSCSTHYKIWSCLYTTLHTEDGLFGSGKADH